MARLRSVNVGLPKDVPWRGRSVYTGIWKSPVGGAVLARRLNLDGDGQGDLGGHGGEQRAVFVYQLDSYDYWRNFLGRDDFTFGQFGENFTVDGLADDEVRIGDRYRIGSALFEVTQPRVTCYRVGMRMADPRMPALLVQHRRPGFYLRVLDEGEVRAGDEIVKVADGPEAMTVAEVDALLYLPGHPRDRIERALRIPALSPGWQGSFRAMLAQPEAATGNAGLAETEPAPAWSGFRPLRVTAVTAESSTIASVRLADPGGTPVATALPGQFLTVRLKPGLVRSYSLSGEPGDAEYRISVKREPHGQASGYLHTHVRPGDVIDVAAPRGTFVLRAGAAPVLLISGGVGATPVLAMLHALAAERSRRPVWWVQAARNGAERPFATEVSALLADLPAAHSYVAFSRPGADDVLGRDYDGAGRLSATVLGGLGLPDGAEAYLCGPSAFLGDVSAALAEIGVPAGRIHTEIFGSRPGLTPGISAQAARAPHPPAGEPGDGPAVSFVRSDLSVPWPESAGSLLELAEACDVPVRWSCRVGVCHTCETGLLSGEVEYATEPVDPPADGNVLVCSSRPRSAVVLDL
ncbi:MOSC and FAD-binding oxidoreductase domain-containing protein [Actinoplanes sp. KI2]|uniref:MOSC and FAD-binding oxidoreductase domain-containing protein n=1 Tax=Actinoplanes sp. KI2 TaxID=2983315 RepID=UPI0021D59D13|nr:MOSC and FAD-binding oxidoreductase domain-containing protein [Actinoplanes sp. KI2]MCU7727756.1 MOSC and FAD-binding oxidoreductase domain-containing protein [Actinoplanes sp. KI2]